MTDASPFLAAIDALRESIARDTELLAALERRVGVQTIASAPALPSPAAPKRQVPPPDEPRRAALSKDDPPAPTKRVGKVDAERVRAMHAEGKNDIEIGAEFGVSPSAITLWRKKLGLTANGKGGRRPKAPLDSGVERVNSAATIVRWLKERGTIIADEDPGKTWKVNARDVIDRDGLLTMANRKRSLMYLRPFAWEFDR